MTLNIGALHDRFKSHRLAIRLCGSICLSSTPATGQGRDTMTIKVGDKVPDGMFMTSGAEGPRPISTDELFAGKTVAFFAVPGAFTPTCSAKHVPGFKEHAAEFRAKGVDTIACVSVNDVFVMKAWGADQGVGDDIVMLADGNGDFTKALGLEMDGSKFGMGTRSQRYSMLVKDGVVETLNVEQGGEFKVSAADYMLPQLG
jgi:peroxiredoxin